MVFRVFCRFQVAYSQFVEEVVGGVLPGFQCRGSSSGWDGEGVVPGCLSRDVAHKVFCTIFPSGGVQCV